MPLTNPGSATATATATNSFNEAPVTNLALTANTPSSIAAKPTRKYLLIVNTGNSRVLMSTTAFTQAAPHIPSNPAIPIEPGGNYEFNATNLFLGAVSLISTVATSVIVMES